MIEVEESNMVLHCAEFRIERGQWVGQVQRIFSGTRDRRGDAIDEQVGQDPSGGVVELALLTSRVQFRDGHQRLLADLAAPALLRQRQGEGIDQELTWIGSGKLGFPDRAIVAFAMGADLVNIAREAMLSIGCIQAQKCHTDRCPAGVATQSEYLARAIEPEVQSLRYARFCQSLRNEILAVTHAAGYEHPSQFTMRDIEVGSGPGTSTTLAQVYGYDVRREWRSRSAHSEAA